MVFGVWRRKTVLIGLVLLLSAGVLPLALPGAERGAGSIYAEDGGEVQTQTASEPKQGSYEEYLAIHKADTGPVDELTINAASHPTAKDMQARVLNETGGKQGSFLWTDETGAVSWTIEVKASGMYNMEVSYFPVEGKSSAIERQLQIDGQIPFEEAGSLLFPRVWGNEQDVVARDNRGNDIRPRQIEKPGWQEAVVGDAQGYYEEPLQFYLSAGTHTVTLVSVREPMVIDHIKFLRESQPKPYAEVVKQYAADGIKPAENTLLKVQGEAAVRKSDPTLYPVNDRSSPATEPYDVSKIRMNTIGGYFWRLPGQWIEWEVDAPQDGLYKLAFKSRQSELRGMYSTRRLTIDGQVPFQEADSLRFLYRRNWEMFVLGGDSQPALVHLKKGKHTIRLEVTLGDMAPLIRQVENSLLELNDLYRQILKITGTTPDPNRDYHLDRQIPNLTSRFTKQSEVLNGVGQTLTKLTGEKSDKVASLYTAAYQLADFAHRPDTIQHRLDTFKINIGSIGTWILTSREQPLQIDYLVLASPEAKLPKADSSWLTKVKHEVVSFFYSFVEDYNSIGNAAQDEGKGKSVTVWIGTGRDQAQVMKTMIDDTFTPQTGIQVNLKLVNMSVLLPATLAGQGPDVAMQIGNETPVNFAMRAAAHDLSEFPDYKDVATRFSDSALVPYRYGDKTYALPEQQTFGMLFYRKDILAELGLQVPNTWDDVYNMIPVLQKNNMQFALPLEQNFARMPSMPPNDAFLAFLLQRDGSLYSDGGKRNEFDSEPAMEAFKMWAEFYTSYKMPLTFDFPNRFRVGEMPIGIADYTMYNNLSVSAPEIRGLWDFAPIPGTMKKDGTIRRDEGSKGTAVMMLNNAREKDNAWTFMKWWTSDDAQARFGREMEGLMGAAARYPTANQKALAKLPWPVKDYKNLQEQWKWVQGVPEVPGGYFTGRQLDNAFRTVVSANANARETLYDYTILINDEIASKRKEFKLDP